MDCPSSPRPLALSLTCALALSACSDDVGTPSTGTSTGSESTDSSGSPTSDPVPTTGTPTSEPEPTTTPTTTTGPDTDTSAMPTEPSTGTTNPIDTTTTGDTDTDTDTGDTDTDTGEPIEPIVVCDAAPLVPPAEGTCEISKPGSNGLLIRGTVLAPDTVYENGAVLVDNGTIVCVGCDCLDHPAAGEATELACADGVVSPGLINPHDHIAFAKNKPIGAGVDRYEHRHDWRVGKNGHQKLSVAGNASKEVMLAAELRFIMSGATSAASVGGPPGLLRNLDAGANLLEGLPIKPATSATFPLGDSNGFQLADGCNYNDKVLTTEIEDLDAYLPHIAEGINDFARNEFLCLSQGPNDVVEPNSAIVHAIGLTAQDTSLLHPEQTRVVWSPRSNIVLYGNTAQVVTLDTLGVPLALGTDWVASGSMNLLRELRCADELNSNYYNKHFTDADLWKMVTTHAALATGSENAIGLLKVGLAADISIFNGAVDKHHAAVVRADLEDVALVLRSGEVLYGDAPIVGTAALGGEACEALDVCGVAKLACVAQDVGGGVTLASVTAAMNPTYPLFFCGTPDSEPTCVPSRPGEYTGLATAEDPDGDGVTADDNCPDVFNPPMLIGDGQLDADGDMIGDACDTCPLEAGDACTILDADDIDDDGVPNGTDNCPRDANPNQADAEDDGHGDVCDTCPEANPGPGVCPSSIVAIRNPMDPNHPAPGASVSITGAYVTAVRPQAGTTRGFYVQNDTAEPWNGIFVFTGAVAPTVLVGNRVTVTGIYEEFNGLSEITNPKVTVDDPGVVLPFEPVLLDPATLATGKANAEPFESMLVRTGPVTITTVNADAPMDFDEFIVTGALRVDDQITDNVKDMGLNNKCPVGTTFEDLIGVVAFSFFNSKLLPRSAADVVLGNGNACDPFAP